MSESAAVAPGTDRPALTEPIAVFDLDGTITRRDTYAAFLLHVLRRRPSRAVHLPRLAWAAGLLKLGRLSRDEAKTRVLRAVLGGCTQPFIAASVASFVPPFITSDVKRAARERIGWHRAQGHRLVMATASLDLYAVPLAEALGFDSVVCTRTEWRDGQITGELDGSNLLGHDKLAAVNALIDPAMPRPPIFAYSDHHSDLPLLQQADHAVAVDPSRALRASVAGTGIRIESWR